MNLLPVPDGGAPCDACGAVAIVSALAVDPRVGLAARGIIVNVCAAHAGEDGLDEAYARACARGWERGRPDLAVSRRRCPACLGARRVSPATKEGISLQETLPAKPGTVFVPARRRRSRPCARCAGAGEIVTTA